MENLIRHCPQCNKTITYARKHGFVRATKNNSLCISCINTNRGKDPAFREKVRQTALKRVHPKSEIEQARAQLRQVSNKRPVYEIWVEKFGQDEADRLDLLRKEKWSAKNTGKNNPMYGKPAPQGSGNGWSGWYRGNYFRSLHELNCILHFEENKISYKTAESKKYRIQYTDAQGVIRNYYPDFITNTGLLIECKPKRLWNTHSVQAKTKAAESWCKEHGLIFALLDYGKPSLSKIQELMAQGLLKLIPRYVAKFQESYK